MHTENPDGFFYQLCNPNSVPAADMQATTASSGGGFEEMRRLEQIFIHLHMKGR
jgi:hypothetical protein